MTIKIEATRHELEKIENLARNVDTVLDGGDFPSWRDVMYEVQEMLAEAETRETEPLIEDEKTRKAVRAWAEAQGLVEVYCASNGYEIYGGVDGSAIQFKGEPFPFADKNRAYTITELCGERDELLGNDQGDKPI